MSAPGAISPKRDGPDPGGTRRDESSIVYHAGSLTIEPAKECVVREGREERLSQRAFQVLLLLVRNRQRIVTKEELLEAVWGGVAVTDDSLVQCIVEVRKTLGDDARRPRFVSTVPKRGYRFVAEVDEEYVRAEGGITIEESSSIEVEVFEGEDMGDVPALPPIPARRAWRIAAVVALLVSAAALHTAWSRRGPLLTVPRIAGKQSLAVLFFENRSGTPQLDWLREGLTDMLITDLSRSRGLSVLSRHELQALLSRRGAKAGEPARIEDALEIARRVKADAFLLGGFTAMGEKLRVDVQIHAASGGQLVTSETLTLDRADQILGSIDLLAFKIAGRLGVPLRRPDERSLGDVTTRNLEAYRDYSIAVEKIDGMKSVEALALLDRAVALDPGFAMAWARIGYVHTITSGDAPRGRPYLEKAFGLQDRLSERDRLFIASWYAIANVDYPRAITAYRRIITAYPLEADAYVRLGLLLVGEGRRDEAERVLRAAVAVDPENPEAHNRLALIAALEGRHDEALEMATRYLALAPQESKPNAHDTLGMVLLWAGRYDEAIAEYGRALAASPRFEVAVKHLAAAYTRLGRYRDARAELERFLAMASTDGDRATGHEALASLSRRIGDRDAAWASARRMLEYAPDYFWMPLAIAAERGDRAEVARLSERMDRDPSRSARGVRLPRRPYVWARGVVAASAGDTAAALALFQEAVRLEPMIFHVEPLEDCLATAYLAMKRWDDAAAECRRLIRLDPNDALAHDRLGIALLEKGDARAGREELARFLAIWKDADPDIPEVVRARQLLDRR